ncbi:MAG: transposase [Actinobacteria bacterium]|nr:transposase [Actinomycetota bacterium]
MLEPVAWKAGTAGSEGAGAQQCAPATRLLAADALSELGATVHLAHPLGVKAFSYRRVKNDERDAADLADLLRMGRLPEAWIAPPGTRELRELVRHRAKLVALRSNVKCQVHGVLAACGVQVLIAGRLAGHRGYRVIQQIGGIGPTFAAIFVAEIGEVGRFTRPEKLTCWAGLTPRHRESDTTVRRGPITKQGSTLVRWAAIEACQRTPAGTKLAADRARIIANRGRNIGVVAAARKLLTLVYYGLRDGQIRALAHGAA